MSHLGLQEITWEEEQKNLLREWIRENKSLKVPLSSGLPELSRLFPGKENCAIYSLWRTLRLEMGLSPVPRELSGVLFTEHLSNCVNEIFEKTVSAEVHKQTYGVVTERIDVLEKENKKLRQLLEKLANVRKAVE